MNYIDLIVLFSTLGFIVSYGVYMTWGSKNMQIYFRGDSSMKWGTIGLSVMATQASAITFISTPGQAYESGMGFVQNYFGLPIALIVVSSVFLPIYYKLKVYTAYEYLENRFDYKTRRLGAFLFLIQRGLAAGITIYAPAIILSTILHWDLDITIIFVGILVIIYTVSGGTKAVSITQKHQMTVIIIGMFIAFGFILYHLSEHVTFYEALSLAGATNKLEAIDFSFDIEKRYTIWSGLLGGFFLALSYFGTDQSQVQRYLGGKNVNESRMGLMFNAVMKIPMQFFILLLGVMLYVFYIYHDSPIYFNQNAVDKLEKSTIESIENEHYRISENRKIAADEYIKAINQGNIQTKKERKQVLLHHEEELQNLRSRLKHEIVSQDPTAKSKDSDYVFLTFILNHMPHGLIGLLIAVIFSAAMSSTSGELNSLASTTAVDFYKGMIKPIASESHYLNVSKLFTAIWGIVAILFAFMAKQSENLIELVNILGSIFYGTILGIFLVAFFIKFVKGSAVFYAAIVAQCLVIVLLKTTDIGYLWFNAIGCITVVITSIVIQIVNNKS